MICRASKKRVVGAAGAEETLGGGFMVTTAPPNVHLTCLFPLRLSQVTKVKTDRPLPENPYHSRPRPEPNPEVEGDLKPARHGSRLFFWTM